jgi:hypothetical protein
VVPKFVILFQSIYGPQVLKMPFGLFEFETPGLEVELNPHWQKSGIKSKIKGIYQQNFSKYGNLKLK